MYVLETCDPGDAPEDREYVAVGHYATAAAAVAAARAMIEDHLSLAITAGHSAAEALDDWQRNGELPRIVARGGAPVVFDALAFARARVSVLARRN